MDAQYRGIGSAEDDAQFLSFGPALRLLTTVVSVNQEGFVTVRGTAPEGFAGTAVITADVGFGAWQFREWTEALVTAPLRSRLSKLLQTQEVRTEPRP